MNLRYNSCVDNQTSRSQIAKMILEAKGDPKYWLSRTPQERIQAIFYMQEQVYGYATMNAPIKRVIKIVKLKDS